MVKSVQDNFDLTMAGLEAGLLVRHIATFDLRTCSVDDPAIEVLDDPFLSDFDYIPVRGKAGSIVGVLGRVVQPVAGHVAGVMRTLEESLVVSAAAPLISFVRMAGTAPYKLVLTESGIEGIVTRSDLLKLPVRLLLFALVTHLEMLMSEVIRTRYRSGDETWLDVLSEGRRDKVTDKRAELKRLRREPELLELTDFCDKRDIVEALAALGATFDGEMKDIELLRNTLAHAGTFINDDNELHLLSRNVEAAEKWIAQLRSVIGENITR